MEILAVNSCINTIKIPTVEILTNSFYGDMY